MFEYFDQISQIISERGLQPQLQQDEIVLLEEFFKRGIDEYSAAQMIYETRFNI